MAESAKVTYSPRSDATPEAELDALKTIYQRAIERYDEGKEGGPAITAPDDAEGESNGIRTTPILPKQTHR